MILRYIFNKNRVQKQMKKSNSKFLKEFEADFITAIFYNYTRQLPTSALMEIDRIYTEETGNILNINFGCSNCILKLMRLVGVMYFKENIDNLDDDLKQRFKEKYRI